MLVSISLPKTDTALASIESRSRARARLAALRLNTHRLSDKSEVPRLQNPRGRRQRVRAVPLCSNAVPSVLTGTSGIENKCCRASRRNPAHLSVLARLRPLVRARPVAETHTPQA